MQIYENNKNKLVMGQQKIIKQQFSARLREDDIEIITEALPDIFPEKELDSLSGREILRGAVEKAVMTISKTNKSRPEDVQKIADLKTEVTELHTQLEEKDGEIKGLKAEVSGKSGEIANIQSEIERLEGIISEKDGTVKKLEQYKPIPNEIRGQLPELTKVLLVSYARKVSTIRKQEIRPFDVLVSLFNRYITKKEVELPGFPFVISDSEIRKAKAEIDGKEPAE
jgi:predicted nuclease with TOPRIM domain